jgi:N-acetylglucosamine-6-sulfatase
MPPSYNETDVSDKPAWIQAQPLLDDDCAQQGIDCHQEVAQQWRGRQEALMSVDVMVRDLLGALEETNQAERTYVVFASDNGFLLFEHRAHGKNAPYEESLSIPLVVRGPGVGQGVVSSKLVANIDLVPTIAQWAGVRPPDYVDGRSLIPVLEGTATSWRRYLLFESYGARAFSGVRTRGQDTYVQYKSGEKEYYELTVDPWQLMSRHAGRENAERLKSLSTILSNLNNCKGASCRVADGGS